MIRPFVTALALLLLPTTARAADGFWSRYNLGVTYEASTSYAQITYDSPTQKPMPSDCVADGTTSMRCTAYLAPDGGSPSFSVFLEEPFKRQGLFYFEPGFTFATVSYTGGITQKPTPKPRQSGAPGPTPDQPLTKAYMEMYGINWQGYLRFGITPHYLPDVLVSLGLGVQTVGGRLKIYTQDNVRFVAQPEAFGEVALVLARFGTGSFSVYLGQDQTLGGTVSSQLVEDNPDGTQLTNFHLGLASSALGARLLFPF